MILPLFFVVITALTNTQGVTTQTKTTRTKTNFFDPVLSANVYIGHVKENERIVNIEPLLRASDADPFNSPNGKICGYELSIHKHDDIIDDITKNIPFIVELTDSQPVLKLKSNVDPMDCEIKQTHRLFIRAYDCASADKRRFSERSSLIITVDDVNEYAPVFTHDSYIFKLYQGQTCESSSCRVEATDDDCGNRDHRVCGYEIITANVPFTIDSNGSISLTKTLNSGEYQFDVIAIDCSPSSDNSKTASQSVRVTFKIIESCKQIITDNTPAKLTIQSDETHLFDNVNVNTCAETCNVADIIGKVELDTNGIDSGCNAEQCSTINHEYVLLAKDVNSNPIPQSQIMSFNGHDQALTINSSDFSGHLNNEFIIRMWMKYTNNNNDKHNITDKEHIFCKSDEKFKNRHHTALLVQNNRLKLLIRKGPLSTHDKTMYASQWIWKLAQLKDNKWHSYKLVVNYPSKIDLYVDEQLIITTNENFQMFEEYALGVIKGTENTIFTLGACWHGRASRMVQHFHGELSGLSIEQKEELQRSSNCIRDCRQYLDIPDIQTESGVELASNSNRSMWMLRTDTSEAYEKLLKHLVYRNKLNPIGPYGQRTVSIHTQIKCLGDSHTFDLPTFTRYISIDKPKLPTKIELKGDTSYLVPENVINKGIYLFRNLSIYTNAIKKNQGDISDCSLVTTPVLSNDERIIVPNKNDFKNVFTQSGVMLRGIASIDSYQYTLQQIAFISKSPIKYGDRTFTLSCVSAQDQITTNELRLRIHIERQMAPSAHAAAVLSNKLVVDNDIMRENIFDVDESQFRSKRDGSGWPIAVVICVSIGLAGVLVLYLVVRIRSNNRQRNPITNTNDDIHSQMEWEDDIGLNITINPLDETKKSVQSVSIHNVEQKLNEYPGVSSDDDDDEKCEEEDDFGIDQSHPRKVDHQLEWDDAAIEYGPKKV